jgi:phage-related minor tail protein
MQPRAGMANGGAFSDGMQFFANGGVVDKTTPFGMANNKLGVMGEAGPEAIMPLARGSDGKLGVRGGGGGNAINVGGVTVVIQTKTNDPKEHGKMAGAEVEKQLKALIHKEVADSYRPGNTMNKSKVIGGGAS